MIFLNVFFTLMVLYFIFYGVCSFVAYTELCTLTDDLIQSNKSIDVEDECVTCDYWMFMHSFVFWAWNQWMSKPKGIKIFILPFSMLKTISKIRKDIFPEKYN